jgi:hypothetical protein
MNLNDIKGIIEINGESYDPKAVLKALLDQGLKIHPLNGSLLIGRTFVDSAPKLQYGSKTCPISDQCKTYDRLNFKNLEATQTADFDFDQNPYPSNPSQNQTDKSSVDRFYTDPIRLDLDDIDITDLFSETPEIASSSEEFEGDFNLDSNYRRDLDSDPAEMMGLSPVTRYGRASNIQESTIPPEHRSRCPECQSIVNIKWRFCGSCGTNLD